MLNISRHVGQSIIINGNIRIKVKKMQDKQVYLGIDAPPDVIINREEIQNKIDFENALHKEGPI